MRLPTMGRSRAKGRFLHAFFRAVGRGLPPQRLSPTMHDGSRFDASWPRGLAGLSKRSSNGSRLAGDRKGAIAPSLPLARELHRIHPVEVASHREVRMTAYNCVRFRVRPGQEERFEQLFRSALRDFEGLRKMALSKAADGSYFSIAEWESLEAIAAARPMMKANLDTFRDTLLELSQDLGGTDPISGEAIFEMAR
ncbi:antibiotic biosynthesis monooxygenase family protein [Ensifer adhaerens]|uniref:antibiotic biosynthesis monooxygenase family protein n=1 Tax=Ensifer adhaerens TaxID=106592 RepID=UPI003CFC21DC